MADHDQLRVAPELGDQAEEAVQVHVVERGLDLVHHVEGRGPAAEHGEQIGQRREGSLATGQQGELLDVLAARLGLDLDAGVEQVVRIGQHELADATREQHREQALEVDAHVGESRREHRLDLHVDGLDDPGQLTARVADVFELGFEERVAFLQLIELLERERVDGAEQAQLPLQIAHPRRWVHTLRERRHLGRFGSVGLQLEVAAQRLDSGLHAHARLGLFDLDPPSPLARLVELLLRCGTCPARLVEAGDEAADLLALAAALLVEIGQTTLDGPPVALDDLAQSAGGLQAALDRDPALGGFGAGHGIRLEPALGLGDAPLEELLALVQARIADLEVLATRRQQCSATLDARPGLATRSCSGLLGILVCFETRDDRVELGDPAALARHALGRFGNGALDGLDLGDGLASVALYPHERLGGCGEPRVVGIEATGELVLGLLRGLQLGLRAAHSEVGALELGGGLRCPLDRLLQGCSGGSTTSGAEAPAGPTEAVAQLGHDGRCRMLHRGIDRIRPVAHQNRTTEQRVEQRLDLGAVAAGMGANVSAHRLADGRRVRCRRRRSEGNHRSSRLRRAQ